MADGIVGMDKETDIGLLNLTVTDWKWSIYMIPNLKSIDSGIMILY